MTLEVRQIEAAVLQLGIAVLGGDLTRVGNGDERFVELVVQGLADIKRMTKRLRNVPSYARRYRTSAPTKVLSGSVPSPSGLLIRKRLERC
jgi:hypothetical protein